MTALADAAVGYLAIRRALGHQLVGHGRLLEDFVAHLTAHDQTTVTIDAAIAWASVDGASPATIGRRLSVTRCFATYLVAFDPTTQVPPWHLVSVGVKRRTPYIFSSAEVDALMAASGRLPSPLQAAGMTTLIGLMAATGLRTSEALHLDRSDVDLEAGRLVVRYSKYGKTRQLPLHPHTVTALEEYSRRRDQLCPQPAVTSLLLAADGSRLGQRPVSPTFRRLQTEVGISVPADQRRPRLHDLRHSFAVATLRDWHATGQDVQRQLPQLSAYLGHVNPAHTYWYLQAVPELMTVVADRLDRFLDSGLES